MTSPYPRNPLYPSVPVLSRRTPSREVIVLVSLAGLFVVLIVGILVALRWNAIGQTIGPRCTVGVTGTAANVTVQGWGANADCQSMLGAGTYELRSGPQGVVVCQYEIQGDLVTVRDEGLLKLVGAGICATLQQQNAPGG